MGSTVVENDCEDERRESVEVDEELTVLASVTRQVLGKVESLKERTRKVEGDDEEKAEWNRGVLKGLRSIVTKMTEGMRKEAEERGVRTAEKAEVKDENGRLREDVMR